MIEEKVSHRPQVVRAPTFALHNQFFFLFFGLDSCGPAFTARTEGGFRMSRRPRYLCLFSRFFTFFLSFLVVFFLTPMSLPPCSGVLALLGSLTLLLLLRLWPPEASSMATSPALVLAPAVGSMGFIASHCMPALALLFSSLLLIGSLLLCRRLLVVSSGITRSSFQVCSLIRLTRLPVVPICLQL